MKQSLLLDALRVAAITLVFVAHFGQILDWPVGGFFGIKNLYYVSLGGVGVSIFLVLSGVLAGLGWANKQPSYFDYLYKKVWRIYPLYWMSVPVSVIGYLLGGWVLEGELLEVFPNGLIVDTLGSVSGFYSWLGLWGGPYNNPSWFIALIMSMYVLFPFVYRLLKIQPHVVVIVFLGISIFFRVYVGQNGVPFLDQSFYEGIKSYFYRQYGFMPGRPGDWFPFCRIFEFSLGVYLAMIMPNKFWFVWNRGPKTVISFCGNQSFALFLVHYPFLFLILLFNNLGAPTALSICIYMVLMMALAYGLNKIEAKIFRRP